MARRSIGKNEKLHRILGISNGRVTHDEVIELSLENIPEMDWSVQKIIDRLKLEGIKIIKKGGRIDEQTLCRL